MALAPSFKFVGPKGQTILWRSGRAWTTGLTRLEGLDLWEASLQAHAVLPTGPYMGGDGLRDAVSVFLAARYLFPRWTVEGTPPDMEVPETASTEIVA